MIKYRELIPTRVGFGKGLQKVGKLNNSVFALGADITKSVNVNFFKESFPERFISLGIAEQNIVGVAAGMALAGKIPVMATYGVFAAMRTADQVRISVCYNNIHVIIGGAHAGLSVGPDGATHQALEDIAVMRVMPNMTVLSPCDATQTQRAIVAAVQDVDGPVYIRFGRNAVPDFTLETEPFVIGKANMIENGSDLTIIATGHMVWQAIIAVEELRKMGVNARLLNLHTIKPIDNDAIVSASKETGAIVTVEEHQIYGGMGSAVAEVLSRFCPCPVEFVGMNDSFGESGTPEELLEKYKINSNYIIKAALKVLKRK